MTEGISKVFFVAILAIFFIFYVALDGSFSWQQFLVHFSIIGLSLLHISTASSFNLGVSFSFFALFFFGAIPLLEQKLAITYYGAPLASDPSLLSAASLALLASVLFYAGYRARKGMVYGITSAFPPIHYANRLHRQLVYLVSMTAVLALTTFIAIYYEFDLKKIFFRGFGEELESSPLAFSFVNFFVRPLLFNLVFLIILMRVKERGRIDIAVYFFCLLLLVFVSPVGIARSLAGALYIPLLTLVFFPKLTTKYSIISIVIIAVVVVAPIADVFRLVQLDDVSLAQNFRGDYFFAGHFDAFHNFVQVVELSYTGSGIQVIGALLFWIPRTMWLDKPVGTSFEFAEFAGFTSSNISFPLMAELYVDFGILGVMFGMFLLGILYKELDVFFAKRRFPLGSLSSYILAIGHLELAILGIYLLRGNFLSTFAFTVSLAFTLILLSLMSRALRGVSITMAQALRSR